MYRSLYARDVFAELHRLQREMQEAFDLSPSIRGIGRGGFPVLNVGGTPTSVEIYAFAPRLDPASMEVVNRGCEFSEFVPPARNRYRGCNR